MLTKSIRPGESFPGYYLSSRALQPHKAHTQTHRENRNVGCRSPPPKAQKVPVLRIGVTGGKSKGRSPLEPMTAVISRKPRSGDEKAGLCALSQCQPPPSLRQAANRNPRSRCKGPGLHRDSPPAPPRETGKMGKGAGGRRAILRACLCMEGGSAPARFPLGSPCALDMTAAICLLSSSLSWLRSASTPAGTRRCKGAAGPPPSPAAAAAPSGKAPSPSPPSRLASLPMAAARRSPPLSPIRAQTGDGGRLAGC